MPAGKGEAVHEQRRHGLGAQILFDLGGVARARLMTAVLCLGGFGFEVVCHEELVS